MTDHLPPLILVPDECRPDAKLIVVGEAPWRSEAEKGYPFAGWSGLKLKELWASVGITREEVSILNVYQYPRKPETVKPETMREWVAHLHKRLAIQTDPYVIVPMGNLALWALTGKGYPPWDKPKKDEFQRAGIAKLRGSVLEYRDRLDRRVKVIPTLHPAALARSPGLEVDCLHDWAKIQRELAFKEIRRVERDLRVVEMLEEVEYWVHEWMQGARPLTFDIENPTGATIMIGFATSRHQAITIPTTKSYWKSEATAEKVWDLIKRVLESDIEKVGQGVNYDVETLARERGIHTRNAIWDTANMFHAWMPTLRSFKLDYLASVFTNEEFWKDEAKDPDEAKKYTSNMAAFYRYNGLDAAVTHELFEVATELLRKDGLLEFYVNHYGLLADPLLEIAMTGLKVDEAMRKWRWADLMAERFEVQDRLEAVVGENLMAEKSLSPVKVKRFLYETLRLPTKYKRVKGKEERSVTIDEVAIRTLMEQHKGCQVLQEAGTLMLRLRYLDALEKYFKDKIALEGRMYSKYSPRTEEGRLSSSASNQRRENGEKVGMNAQNISREIRDLFLAG